MVKILTLLFSLLLQGVQPLQAAPADLSAFDAADEEVLDIAPFVEAEMSTAQSLTELAIRFLLNLAVCWVLVHVFYYRKSRRRDYYFTFIIFSTAMLLLLYMMGNAEVGIGLTLGLFAIFGVIRYRTETVPIREMTYLFVIIALAAVNGLSPVYRLAGAATAQPHYVLNIGAVCVTALSNLLVIGLVWVLESERIVRHTSTKLVLYDKIELIVPERRAELVADLEKRIGVKVDNIEVGHVDFLRDAAWIKVFYTLEDGQTGSIDQLTRAKDYIGQ
jgi:hypothetical protein